MKVKLTLKELNRNLQVAMRAIAARPTLPILNYLLIEAEEGKVTLTGYDMEMGIRVSFPCEIGESGSVAVKARTLSEIVSQMPEKAAEFVEFDFNDISRFRISGGRSEFTLVGKPGGEYPRLPDLGDGKEVVTLNIVKFLTNLKKTIFASSFEMPKNYTSGILLSIKGDNLQIVATDGRRLALVSDNLGVEGRSFEKAVLIPSKTMNELARILGMGHEGSVDLRLSENLALFKLSDGSEIEIITHLLDTPYPDYQKVIPEGSEGTITIDKNRLIESLKQVGILARQQDGRDMAVLECTGDKLLISSKAESEGKAEVEVPIERDGAEMKIAFNYQYLLDPLLAVEDDTITLSYSGSLEPGVLKTPSDPSYTYVIMPVRLPE
ncbi:MAG: DNA polymerase III subunit beta [bacterium]